VVSFPWTAGAIGTYVFVANGLFDPDFTSTGHQPLYFDQLAAIYNHYTVVASKIKLTISPVDNTSPTSYLSVYVDDDASGPANLQARLEQSTCTNTVIPFGSGATKTIVTKSYNAKQMFGGDPLSDTQQEGTIASNPNELAYFLITTGDIASTNLGKISALVEIEYKTVWSELKSINVS